MSSEIILPEHSILPTLQLRCSSSTLFVVLKSTTRTTFRRSLASWASCLGLAALALSPAMAQNATPQYQIQPPHGRPGFMVKVEIDNCKHDAAKAPADSQSNAFIACMEKLGYKVTVQNSGNAGAPAAGAPTSGAAATSGSGTPAGTPAASTAQAANAQTSDPNNYSYSGTVDIGGLRVGMSPADARRVLSGEKLTNYNEYTLPLTYANGVSADVDRFNGNSKATEVPNSTFLNVIITDNRPPLQKTTNAKYVNQETVDMSNVKPDHNFFDDVNGKMEYFSADFAPIRGEEILIGISHGVYYDWRENHKGMLLSDFSKGFAAKYGVQVPPIGNDGSQSAVWNVSSPNHTLLWASNKGVMGCSQDLPVRVLAGPYEKPRVGGNFAMGLGQSGHAGQTYKNCGAEMLYLKWKVGNPNDPADHQIVTEYTVGVISPSLSLVGTNKAFDVIKAAMSQQGNSDTKKAAEEGKSNKNPF
jgi:hypothetical protein